MTKDHDHVLSIEKHEKLRNNPKLYIDHSDNYVDVVENYNVKYKANSN
jgi:hypothetical protein